MTHETVSPSLPAAGIRHNTRWLTICGLMMAMNIGLSSFGLPVPGGHLYLNDIIIVTAALILDPAGAFLVGGVGAFLEISSFIPCPCSYPLQPMVYRPWPFPIYTATASGAGLSCPCGLPCSPGP